MRLSSDRLEWRPLSATMVLPVPPKALRRELRGTRGQPAGLATRFPFDLSGRRVLLLRRLGAVAIIPPDLPPEERDHPVPALLLDRSRRLRRSAAGTRTLRFGTAEGYDYYQVASGRLVACWSSPDEVPAASDAVDVNPRRVCRRATTAPGVSRHPGASLVIGAILGVLALVVQLPPRATAAAPALPGPRGNVTAPLPADPASEILSLAGELPDLELVALSVSREGYRWTASTASSRAALESCLADLADQLLTVRVVDGETILTVEGIQ